MTDHECIEFGEWEKYEDYKLRVCLECGELDIESLDPNDWFDVYPDLYADDFCPNCGYPLVEGEESHIAFQCPNPECPTHEQRRGESNAQIRSD